MIERRSVLVDGIRTGYLHGGSGPPLVLLHGLVGSAGNWALNLPALALHHTVYALDGLNVGGSQRVCGLDWGLRASAQRVRRAMEALGLESADLAGHSRGGAEAMMLAALYPHRVRSLILFSPANPFCQRGRHLLRFYGSPAGQWVARQIPRMPHWAHAAAHRRVYGDPRKATAEQLAGYTQSLNRFAIEQTLGIVKSWRADMDDLRSLLPEVARHPTLLLWGERDGVVGLESGRTLASLLRAELQVIAGAGHLPYVEEPELCHGVLSRWFSRMDLRSADRAQSSEGASPPVRPA